MTKNNNNNEKNNVQNSKYIHIISTHIYIHIIFLYSHISTYISYSPIHRYLTYHILPISPTYLPFLCLYPFDRFQQINIPILDPTT